MKKCLTTVIFATLSPLVLASSGFQDNSSSHHHQKEYRQSGLVSSVKAAKDDARVLLKDRL